MVAKFAERRDHLKATGHVRRIDGLGRVVLPVEVRQSHGIADKDEVEIYVEGDSIVLVKHRPPCVICGSREGLVEFKGKMVCNECWRATHGGRSW